jgi:predicted acylesterase/phospholipase RssA
MDIEDLWIPYFAVSSDLSANSVRIHETGPLWRAIRATVSLPAILPPVLEDGHLLVDGGVLNNLPVDVMHSRLQGVIIAVDLAVDNDSATRQTEIPSAAEYIKSRLLPGKQTIDAPTLSRVILKVTTLASRKEVQNARKLADLYLNPPVGDFDLLDWAHMRDIAEIGYQHSLPRIREWLGYNPRHVERSRYMDYWLQQTSA